MRPVRSFYEVDPVLAPAEATVPRPTMHVETRAGLPERANRTARQTRGGTPHVNLYLEDDALGKLVQRSLKLLSVHGFRKLCRLHRGPSCISPTVGSIDHPAGRYLDRLRQVGAPVLQKTPPWSQERRRAALRRGCHRSALEYLDFLRERWQRWLPPGTGSCCRRPRKSCD